MNDETATAPVTEKLRLVLKPTEPVASEAGPELQATIQAGIPVETPESRGQFRKVEFPEEVVADAIERVRELAAQNPRREAELKRNPPAPDAKAARLAELASGIAADVRVLSDLGFIVKVEVLSNPTEALANSPLEKLRRIIVTADDEQVILSGRVSSYYLKQMAQETVRPTLGSRKLINNIVVGPESD